MQILKFSGGARHSDFTGQNFSVGISYTVEMISTDRLSENFIILQQVIDDEDTKNQHEEFFGNTFRVNERYNLVTAKAFATDNNLVLTIKHSDGSDKETLVDGSSSNSSSL